jgi:hypothetical protein
MKNVLRVTLALGALVSLAGAFSGCGGPYIPSAKEGRCNVNREWVPPAQVDGKWREGYCKDA